MKPSEPKATLVMKVNSSRYGSRCARCKGRIRVGRRYVVHPERTSEVLHVGCFLQESR